jgi:phthiocerol/phenolphthiocerol synthesis type-I polyketide synthase C
MSDTATKIARLTPTERAALYLKLRESRAASKSSRAEERMESIQIGSGENFRLIAGTPGIIESLRPRRMPRRRPNPGEVEVEVHAASLNFRDLMLVLGLYPSTQDPTSCAMGTDWSGTVAAVGEGVSRLRVGDEVIGLVISDFSPYVTCSEARVVKRPQVLSHVESSSIPTVFLTAYYALHHMARLQRGERILIHSATGGVGLAALQIARWRGAAIYATAGNGEKRSYLHGLGIEHVFDSHAPDWDAQLSEATRGEGVDVILNSLTGDAIVKGISVLRDGGRFLEIGMRSFYTDASIPLRLFARGVSFMTAGVGVANFPPEQRGSLIRQLLDEIVALFERHSLALPPLRVYPYAEFAAAFSYLSQGIHMGKVALDMQGQSVRVAT